MTAKPENLGHFIFNSDYPTDKIIWLYEGQLTTNSSGQAELYIGADKFPYNNPPAFVKGVGSVDNWQSSFMLGQNVPLAGQLYDSTSISFGRYWDSEAGTYLPKLYIFIRISSKPNTTIKLRLWGIQRDDIAVAEDYGKTSAISKSKLSFDSSNNYPRLYMEGVALSGETVQHNLGKIPYVEYWWRLKSKLVPETKDDAFTTSWDYKPQGSFKNGASWTSIRATKDTITFMQKDNGGEARDAFYYYRLYA